MFNLRSTKTEIDNKLTDNYYDKTYINLSLNNKLNSSELANYNDKTYINTALDNKQPFIKKNMSQSNLYYIDINNCIKNIVSSIFDAPT